MTPRHPDEPPTPTIVSVATAPGIGAIGIVRISGSLTSTIGESMLSAQPPPRCATLANFLGADGHTIDNGIALYYRGPASYTGEDLLELQGHGNPVLLDQIVRRAIELGAIPARPGEFTERAFLNGKLDLAQAEAVSDLITSATAHAARLARKTLEGALSKAVQRIADAVTALRVLVEANIDFTDEEIDIVPAAHLQDQLDQLIALVETVIAEAQQGRVFRDGIRVAIAGPTNAGKSTLLNALAGTESAIVTAIPGTTRDLVREHIQVDGLPIHLIDTAGLRDTTDPVETEGIQRTRGAIEEADHLLWVYAANESDPLDPPTHASTTIIRNKIDLVGESPGKRSIDSPIEIGLSARTGLGMDLLKRRLHEIAGIGGSTEGAYMARRRHLDALTRSRDRMLSARRLTHTDPDALEIIAEELRSSQRALGEITGEITSDDLLGQIFSTFCIGK